MSIVHRAGDTCVRPSGPTGVWIVPPLWKNACDTLRSHCIVVDTRFPQVLGRTERRPHPPHASSL